MKKHSEFGWMELLVGTLLILLGIFTLIRPGSILTGIVVIYGVIAVITGIEDIIIYVKVERYTGFGPTIALITGILSVMCGIMLLVYPDAGKLIISLIFPVWFIAHCISRLSHMNMVRLRGGRLFYYFSLAVNIAGLILGILMIFLPRLNLMTMRALGYVAAFYLILLGIDSIAAGLDKRRMDW